MNIHIRAEYCQRFYSNMFICDVTDRLHGRRFSVVPARANWLQIDHQPLGQEYQLAASYSHSAGCEENLPVAGTLVRPGTPDNLSATRTDVHGVLTLFSLILNGIICAQSIQNEQIRATMCLMPKLTGPDPSEFNIPR
jgi:hypothetical protein